MQVCERSLQSDYFGGTSQMFVPKCKVVVLILGKVCVLRLFELPFYLF